jgi:hypothetical protein
VICVDELKWFKSSYSGGAENCVEVGAAPHRRAVRDTKLGPASPMLVFPSENWETFADTAKRSEFVLPR